MQRLFTRLELNRPPADAGQQQVFGRFEASRPNELWTGDALHGPVIAGRKTYLFCFIDDHSRAVMGARWAFHEDVVRLAAALRPALASRGVPESVYVDNGSAFVDAWLLRACAVLGIKLVHSRPGRPQGRGKIERFFRTVRDQFLVEIPATAAGRHRAADLAELNRLFSAWVQAAYHRAVHSETGQPPLARWAAASRTRCRCRPRRSCTRRSCGPSGARSSKTATVSLHGNLYQVDASLVRCVVELVFDPFDLTDIDVRHKGRPAGKAVPFLIGRHRHAKTRTGDGEQRAEPEPTGIDYLKILDHAHGAACRPRSTTPPSSTARTRPAITRRDAAVPAARRSPVHDFRQMINFDELTSDDAVTLARTAAEAIRGLNRATRHQPAWTSRAAARPQACDLFAAVRAAAGPGGGSPLAPLAPAGQVDRAELTAAGADHHGGPRQPVAAGAQARGHVPAGLPAAIAGPDRVQGAGIAALAQTGLGPARSGRPAGGAGDLRPGAHTGGRERPPRRDGRMAGTAAAAAGACGRPGFAAAGSRMSRSPGSQSSTAQMTSRSSRRIEIGRPDHRCDIFPAEISSPASASSRRRSEDRQMPRWAAASRRFHCMSGLLEPGGGPLGRLLVGVLDGLIRHVHVADRGGQPPVPEQLLDRGQADALAIQPRRARVP